MAASSYAYSYSHPPFSLLLPPAGRHPSLSSLPSYSQELNYAAVSFRHRAFIRVRNSPSPLRVLCMRESRASVVTGKSWNTSILNSETPVLVEFYASWCGPCQMVHRVIDEIATEYAGKLKCFVLNADKDLQVVENYDIKAVPVVLLLKNGEKCDTVVGTMPKEFYVTAIERVLAS